MNKFFDFLRGTSRLLMFFILYNFVVILGICFGVVSAVLYCSLLNSNELFYSVFDFIIEHKIGSIICFIVLDVLGFIFCLYKWIKNCIRFNPEIIELLDRR